MNKLFLAFCLTIISSVFAVAQATDDYKKVEGYIGYSNQQIDLGTDSGSSAQDFFNDRLTFHGGEAAVVFNVHRYVGIKADVSGAYRNKDVSFSSTVGTVSSTTRFETKNSIYNFLGGVQVKDNSSEARVKPFAHALVGAAHVRTKVENCTSTLTTGCTGFTNATFSDTGLAGAFGGGLDIKLNDRVDLRAFQVDYNPVRVDGRTDNNFRFGIGFVFK